MNPQTPKPDNNITIREAVARILYPISMIAMLIWLLASTLAALAVMWIASSERLEPEWFHSLDHVLKVVARVLTSAQADKTTTFYALATGAGAVIMGVFLHRCSGAPRPFEIATIIGLLCLGLAGLVILFVLPSPEEAARGIQNGEEIIQNLIVLLGRNSNIALAVCGAALGINLGPTGGK